MRQITVVVVSCAVLEGLFLVGVGWPNALYAQGRGRTPGDCLDVTHTKVALTPKQGKKCDAAACVTTDTCYFNPIGQASFVKWTNQQNVGVCKDVKNNTCNVCEGGIVSAELLCAIGKSYSDGMCMNMVKPVGKFAPSGTCKP